MLTAKQEAFCLAIVEGYNQSEAYRRAYDAGRMAVTTIEANASRLVRESKVSARIASLRAEAAAATRWTVQRIVAQYEANMQAALEERPRQVAAANTAVKGIADILGLGERAESERQGDTHNHLHLYAGLSVEELARIAGGQG